MPATNHPGERTETSARPSAISVPRHTRAPHNWTRRRTTTNDSDEGERAEDAAHEESGVEIRPIQEIAERRQHATGPYRRR